MKSATYRTFCGTSSALAVLNTLSAGVPPRKGKSGRSRRQQFKVAVNVKVITCPADLSPFVLQGRGRLKKNVPSLD